MSLALRHPVASGVATALLLAIALVVASCDRFGCGDAPARDQRALGTDGAVARSDVISRTQTHMGTLFTITIPVATAASDDDRDRVLATIDAAFAEIARVEAAISSWQPDSDTTRVNRAAGAGPVLVGPDLAMIVGRAIELSEVTGGAFDITFASCAHLWSIDPPRRPSDTELAECLPSISWRHIELTIAGGEARLRLTRPGTQIGLGAIGKGYGIDRAGAVLSERGFESFIVEGGGDVLAAGTRIGQPWRVGIQAPRGPRGEVINVVEMPGEPRAVATSGDYEQFVETSGERIHHIIDPRTGQVAAGTIAVSVIAPDATLADALATGLLVLGPTEGLRLVESLDNVEALIIDADDEPHVSTGFLDYGGD